MKNIKTFLRILMLALVFSAGILVSCHDQLQEEVFSFVGATNYWKTADDANAGILGAYESFLSNDYFGRFYFELTEMPADFTTINRNDTYQQLDRWDLLANHPFVLQGWNIMYQQISRANGVIQNVPKITMDETRKKSIVAEAKFIRAFDFFNIARLWGAAPMPLQVVEGVSTTQLPRTSVDSLYIQIEKDLKDAEIDLPATRTGAEVGRATSGAAKTLLAWAYLTQKKWALAAAKAQEVIAGNQYKLLPKFDDVFSVANKNNAEIVFSIQFDGTTRGHALSSYSNAGGTNNPYCFQGVNVYSVDPKSDIWTKWDKNEYRRNFTVYNSVRGKNGNTITVDANFPSFGKYRCPAEIGINNSFVNPPVLRYPDALLIFAEAEAQAKGGPTAAAYDAINQVRRRAYNLPSNTPDATVDLKNLSLQAFTDAVIEERGYEFVMECHRIYDLLRTGTFKTKIQSIGKAAPRGSIYPIPQSELDANTRIGINGQNPGW
jgi:starch-binding outer membrane protein, SusD/RagB family